MTDPDHETIPFKSVEIGRNFLLDNVEYTKNRRRAHRNRAYNCIPMEMALDGWPTVRTGSCLLNNSCMVQDSTLVTVHKKWKPEK